jgi:hypothetical protein
MSRRAFGRGQSTTHDCFSAHNGGFLFKAVHVDGAKTSEVLSFSSYFHPHTGQYRTSNTHGIIGTKHMCSLNTPEKK